MNSRMQKSAIITGIDTFLKEKSLNITIIIVMRLGKKKEKDREMEKEQLVDGVARLICAPKSHQAPLRGRSYLGLGCIK